MTETRVGELEDRVGKLVELLADHEESLQEIAVQFAALCNELAAGFGFAALFDELVEPLARAPQPVLDASIFFGLHHEPRARRFARVRWSTLPSPRLREGWRWRSRAPRATPRAGGGPRRRRVARRGMQAPRGDPDPPVPISNMESPGERHFAEAHPNSTTAVRWASHRRYMREVIAHVKTVCLRAPLPRASAPCPTN